MPLELLLIRHGDPDYAHDRLTAQGKREALRLAADLERAGLDDLYVSPRGRARETCGFTAERLGMAPTVLDWASERGIRRGEIHLWEAPGDMFLRTAREDAPRDRYDLDAIIPEGREQYERVGRGCDQLLATHGYLRDGDLYRVETSTDQRIALFCHKGVILTLLADLLHWPLQMIFVSLEIRPTGVTRLVMVEREGMGHWKAVEVGGLGHLREG